LCNLLIFPKHSDRLIQGLIWPFSSPLIANVNKTVGAGVPWRATTLSAHRKAPVIVSLGATAKYNLLCRMMILDTPEPR